MDKARVYVDLNEMIADDITLFPKDNTTADSMGNIITFYEGLPVSLYSDDASDSGETDNMIFEGTAIKYDIRSYPEWWHVSVLTNVATISGAMIPAGFTLPYWLR